MGLVRRSTATSRRSQRSSTSLWWTCDPSTGTARARVGRSATTAATTRRRSCPAAGDHPSPLVSGMCSILEPDRPVRLGEQVGFGYWGSSARRSSAHLRSAVRRGCAAPRRRSIGYGASTPDRTGSWAGWRSRRPGARTWSWVSGRCRGPRPQHRGRPSKRNGRGEAREGVAGLPRTAETSWVTGSRRRSGRGC